MTLHRLGAGDGYTYLTRQTAAGDDLRGRQGLEAYYAASGNPPGVWAGTGAAELGVAGEVSEAQMKHLFGLGEHPDTGEQLGRRFPVHKTVEERIAERLAALGDDVDDATRARIEAEEAGKGERQAVAGWDLVFTPVKSASVLWALATDDVRAEVEAAHDEAWRDVLAALERDVAFTRIGAAGIAQVDVKGLTAAAFMHRDSRCGDPNLHTHMVISNKVQTLDGRWRTLDSKALHHAAVAMSERYNTRFEDAMRRRLGVGFVEREEPSRGNKRPVREVAGVPAELVEAFSRRRAQIEATLAELVEAYRDKHGREPSLAEQLRLAEVATLRERPRKAAVRPFRELLARWRREAAAVVGEQGVETAWRTPLGTLSEAVDVDEVDVPLLAGIVLQRVEAERATWTRWHVEAEVERATRPLHCATADDRARLVWAVTVAALAADSSVSLAVPAVVDEPRQLRRLDGESVFDRHAAARYTSLRILAAEDGLVAAGRQAGAPALAPQLVDAVLAGPEFAGRLAPDQVAAARRMTTSGRQLDVLIGPAGAGKTTTMRAVVRAWKAGGGEVLLLAPSAAAAAVLARATGCPAENVAKWLYESDGRNAGEPAWTMKPGHLVLVDEASMVGTLNLARLTAQAQAAGAAIRLLGDHRQLTAVEAGGALRLLDQELDVAELVTVRRFADAWEGPASLRLRDGDSEVLDIYRAEHRVRDGSRTTMVADVYRGWLTDTRAGRVALMVAADNTTVAALAARARAERVAAGEVEAGGVRLRDGALAGVGDRVVTRRNDRRLVVNGAADFVKNRDVWTVAARHDDGSLTVSHARHGGAVRLPADYVATQVELAYATTGHGAQGMTVDTCHALLAPGDSREYAYVAATRATDGNHLYLATHDLVDLEVDHKPHPIPTPAEAWTAIMRNETAERSATELLRAAFHDNESIATLLPRYEHAATYADTARYEEVARAALPAGEGDQLLADPAWPALAHALRQAETAGLDAAALLPAVYAEREVATADSLAQVLHHRVDLAGRGTVPAAASRPLVAGLFPTSRTGPGPLDDYLRQLEGAIAARADVLGEAALLEQPAWTAALGPVPADPVARARWTAAATGVAAYREAYDITTPDPLGPPAPVGDTTRSVARAAAEHAVARARTVPTEPETLRARLAALAIPTTGSLRDPADATVPSFRGIADDTELLDPLTDTPDDDLDARRGRGL